MKVEFLYSTNMIISFDGTFNKEYRGSLDIAIDLASDCIEEHNFHYADIIDGITGEIIAVVRNEEDDDLEEEPDFDDFEDDLEDDDLDDEIPGLFDDFTERWLR